MPTTRPFAYNTGSTISGTNQYGNVAVGVNNLRFDNNIGGVKWWMGPDEDSGYVIAVPSTNQPTNIVGVTASVGFYRTSSLTDQSFVDLSNVIPENAGITALTTASQAKTWLNNTGYWTSYTNLQIEYLVVGGGGGSGTDNRCMGGGGAGGLLTGTTTLTATTSIVTVGAGGAAIPARPGLSSLSGNKGNSSSITGNSINVVAFGGGASDPRGNSQENGANGAGASVFSSGIGNGAGTGISGQGNNGGNGQSVNSSVRYAGGGGGFSATGGTGSSVSAKGGNGGAGGTTTIRGTSETYAGGGGGNSYTGTVNASGGSGGGGAGCRTSNCSGTSGTVNTGGGGGGGAAVASAQSGGGSGIVVIRYAGSTALATGGTITYIDGYVVHTFTGTGIFTVL